MTKQEMWEAVKNSDANYDGLFFYGVKTTGIFCRPSCQSKVPKQENILYFRSSEEARKAGFRPCKRCRSDLLEYQPMHEIADEIIKKSDTYWASLFLLVSKYSLFLAKFTENAVGFFWMEKKHIISFGAGVRGVGGGLKTCGSQQIELMRKIRERKCNMMDSFAMLC